MKKKTWIISLLGTAAVVGGGLIAYKHFNGRGLTHGEDEAPMPDDTNGGDDSDEGETDTARGQSASNDPAGQGQGGKVNAENLNLETDESGLSRATVFIKTAYGVIKFKLYSKDAPQTVGRIVELTKQGFYNGLTFHRVVPGFVIQGGDPQGNGTGGSGKNLKAEFNDRHHIEGTVAMARAQDPNSADSQFYITLGPQPHLDRSYTVFGQVVEGMDVVKKIQAGDRIMTMMVE